MIYGNLFVFQLIHNFSIICIPANNLMTTPYHHLIQKIFWNSEKNYLNTDKEEYKNAIEFRHHHTVSW